MTEKRFPVVVWLIVPILILVAQTGVELFLPRGMMDGFHSEGGPHEAFQALFLVIGFFVGLYLVCIAPTRGLRAWAMLAMLGCFYTGGEELSWGQHMVGWTTPENWAQYNDQNETNLHNTSAWLDQKPRILLEIGVIVGGLIVPALRRWWPEKLPARFAAIYPPSTLAVTALMFAGIKLIESVTDIFDHHLFWRASEVEELYLFYFVMLYLFALVPRFKRSVDHSL